MEKNKKRPFHEQWHILLKVLGIVTRQGKQLRCGSPTLNFKIYQNLVFQEKDARGESFPRTQKYDNTRFLLGLWQSGHC